MSVGGLGHVIDCLCALTSDGPVCILILLIFDHELLAHTSILSHTLSLYKQSALFSTKEETEVQQQHALTKGSIVEFEEKGRKHIGTIQSAEHNANGKARYTIVVQDGEVEHKYDVADKEVLFSTPRPTNEKQAVALIASFLEVQEAEESVLLQKLGVTPELLEMAWEETIYEEPEPEEEEVVEEIDAAAAVEGAVVDGAAEEVEGTEDIEEVIETALVAENKAADPNNHELTAKSFIQLLQGKKASPVEEYMAWKLLQGEMAHVFFKDMKVQGRILSFKAKPRKGADNAKEVFCQTHEDVEFCDVEELSP